MCYSYSCVQILDYFIFLLAFMFRFELSHYLSPNPSNTFISLKNQKFIPTPSLNFKTTFTLF